MTQTDPDANDASRKSLLERALGLVTDVQPGEAPTALLLMLNVFVLLAAYYVIKPVREGFILEMQSGAEYKSAMGGVIAASLLVLVPVYAKFASKVSRGVLVTRVTLFFASHLVLFYLGSSIDVVRHHLGLLFFLWVGVFNMMLVAQFWAFANDIYSEEQGKRLFPLVGLGASVGAAAGSQITKALALSLGRDQLLLVSAGMLVLCAGVFSVVNRRESGQKDEAAAAPSGKSSVEATSAASSTVKQRHAPRGAFGLVLRHRYLRLLAAFSLVFTLVNTNGEYLLGKLFKEAAAEAVASGAISAGMEGDFITAEFGSFFFYVNVFGVLTQMLLVSRIVKYGGLRVAFFILPTIAFAGAMSFALVPLLWVIRTSKVAENATDYSLNNTVRNMLWLPTTREMKYRAKQAVDTFFVRLGDMASTAFVFLFVVGLDLNLRQFSACNAVVVVIWLFLARGIVKENGRLSEASESPSPRGALGTAEG